MKLLSSLRAAQAEAGRKAQEVMQASEAEGREMTPEERASIQSHLDEARAIKARIERVEGDASMLDEISRLAGSSPSRDAQQQATAAVDHPTRGQAQDISAGAQFVASDAFLQNVRRGGRFSTGAVQLRGETLTTGGASAGALIAPDRRTQIVDLRYQELTIVDLIGSTRTTSNSIIVPTETLNTNAAATVAEGGLKPESTIRFSSVTEAIKKIATVLKVSDEALEDIPYLQTYIDGRGRFFVRQTEEIQVLNGDGLGNNLLGLRNRVGLTPAQAKGADTGFDAVHKQITKILLNSFLAPDGIVMHPTDWENLALAKGTDGRYIGASPFEPLQQKRLWGLPVVTTTAMTLGTAFIGAYRAAAALARKGDGISMEMTNANEDDFIHNLVAMRFEERLGLLVYRPAAFGAVTGL